MSTIHAARPAIDAITVPAVLPVIAMTIAADGTMTVAVDEVPYEPPRFGPPWVRSSFATVIDSVLEERGSPVRVLVYEADGTVFTDLVTRPLQTTLDPYAEPAHREEVVETPVAQGLVDAAPFVAPPRVVFGEDGFIPGEEVAVAIIVRHTKASTDGSARALLEPGICRVSADGEVVLVGRISGTCVVTGLT
ncbi:hypothetical protein [Microbacterium pygmaeum]|uniref:Uncharacterized protein n=1 Tax=Microbacterium pygmaeum TaxID=370764 RepID=A0A1G8AJQ7_9MICO|nr:hypothetical protein [Microbacterium pygmaeum]SDH21073.1 hypothetical protein SAMN04489810_2394 [Microbacterium pygmaeum]